MGERGGVGVKEASGALLLIIVILFLQSALFLFYPTEVGEKGPIERESQEVILLVEPPSKAGVSVEKRGISVEKREEPPLFQFDPNTISFEQLMELGLTQKEAQVVLNYREKGGRFRRREEFKKIYSLPEGFYERVESYIVIEEPPHKRTIKREPIELNGADSLQLLELPGIGPYYSSKILRARERQGGFLKGDELMQIEGIDSTRYREFAHLIYTDTLKIVKRDLDSVSYRQLSDNPYIGAYLARSIVRFREQLKEEGLSLSLLLINKIIDINRAHLLRYFFY